MMLNQLAICVLSYWRSVHLINHHGAWLVIYTVSHAQNYNYYYTGSYIVLISNKLFYCESFMHVFAMQLQLLRICNENYYLPMCNGHAVCTRISIKANKLANLPVDIKLHLYITLCNYIATQCKMSVQTTGYVHLRMYVHIVQTCLQISL